MTPVAVISLLSKPRYLEGRAHKFTEADSYQLGCAAVVRGRSCIDKSVFRRNIGRRERIAPGQATVDYIRQHFEVAWIVLPQPAIVPFERGLIERLAAEYDLYNRNGNPRGLVSNSAAQLVAPA